MSTKLRNRRLVIAAALFIAGIASVDTTYAQTAFSREITLPDVVVSTIPTTTIEPGLYVRAGDDVPQAFWNLGIRIEDDAVITPEGCELITRDVPVAPDAIEALMRS